MLRRLLTEGVCIDKDTFLETMRPLCGDLTFAEATLTLTGPSPNPKSWPYPYPYPYPLP